MKFILFLIFPIFVIFNTKGQTLPKRPISLDKQDSWTQKDLIQPSELAAILSHPKSKPIHIFNIGVEPDIRGAQNMGGASKKENLEKFKNALMSLPKSSSIIIYCGCCPFEKCPNIRPAFSLMKNSGYLKGRLLNIPINLKQDWINKGYALNSNKKKS